MKLSFSLVSRELHPWQQTDLGTKRLVERLFVAGRLCTVHSELTVVSWLTDNRHVFSVIAVVNAPASMTTLTQRRLVASTLNVVKPRLSRPTAVVMTKVQAWSPVPTRKPCCRRETARCSATPNDSLIVIYFSLREVKAVIAPATSGRHLSTKSRLNVELKINK